jgi:radical SAM enzyme (TIGR01210 family)
MPQTVNGVPFSSELKRKYVPIYERAINQLTCVVPGGGCVYYRAHKGNVCPFCSFPAFSRHVIRGPGHEDDFKPWTLDAETYMEMYRRSVDDAAPYERLAIFNGGSFFPNAELPDAFQRFVYEDVAAKTSIKQLMVEAYPQFITENKLAQAKERLPHTDFMVGIGFESQDDFVRNSLLKKRISRKDFEAKVRLMQSMEIQVFAYAFLQAPGLNDKQSLDEAIATCRYLTQLGVDEIALSCAFVPPGSILEEMYNRGTFRPPRLWSILEIQEIGEQEGWPLTIGGFDDFPPPVAGPSNCDRCDEDVLAVLDRIRVTGRRPKSLPACSCKGRWHRMIS